MAQVRYCGVYDDISIKRAVIFLATRDPAGVATSWRPATRATERPCQPCWRPRPLDSESAIIPTRMVRPLKRSPRLGVGVQEFWGADVPRSLSLSLSLSLSIASFIPQGPFPLSPLPPSLPLPLPPSLSLPSLPPSLPPSLSLSLVVARSVGLRLADRRRPFKLYAPARQRRELVTGSWPPAPGPGRPGRRWGFRGTLVRLENN